MFLKLQLYVTDFLEIQLKTTKKKYQITQNKFRLKKFLMENKVSQSIKDVCNFS